MHAYSGGLFCRYIRIHLNNDPRQLILHMTKYRVRIFLQLCKVGYAISQHPNRMIGHHRHCRQESGPNQCDRMPSTDYNVILNDSTG